MQLEKKCTPQPEIAFKAIKTAIFVEMDLLDVIPDTLCQVYS